MSRRREIPVRLSSRTCSARTATAAVLRALPHSSEEHGPRSARIPKGRNFPALRGPTQTRKAARRRLHLDTRGKGAQAYAKVRMQKSACDRAAPARPHSVRRVASKIPATTSISCPKLPKIPWTLWSAFSKAATCGYMLGQRSLMRDQRSRGTQPTRRPGSVAPRKNRGSSQKAPPCQSVVILNSYNCAPERMLTLGRLPSRERPGISGATSRDSSVISTISRIKYIPAVDPTQS